MIRTVQPIPIAQTGPRLAVEFRSATVRHNRPRMTVMADAPMGCAAARHATRIASTRLSYSCSSSLYRDTSSSA
jgi:hypothetical protein